MYHVMGKSCKVQNFTNFPNWLTFMRLFFLEILGLGTDTVHYVTGWSDYGLGSLYAQCLEQLLFSIYVRTYICTYIRTYIAHV